MSLLKVSAATIKVLPQHQLTAQQSVLSVITVTLYHVLQHVCQCRWDHGFLYSLLHILKFAKHIERTSPLRLRLHCFDLL